MSYRQIKAIVSKESKEALIKALGESGVTGFNHYKIKGQGELSSFDSRELIKGYCFEIYINTASVDKIKHLIVDTVQTGDFGDGLIAVCPVEEILRIRDCSPKDFKEVQC